jgi:hypothetical protein
MGTDDKPGTTAPPADFPQGTGELFLVPDGRQQVFFGNQDPSPGLGIEQPADGGPVFVAAQQRAAGGHFRKKNRRFHELATKSFLSRHSVPESSELHCIFVLEEQV